MKKFLAFITVAVFALTGCAETSTVTDTKVGNTAGYVIVTDWTKLPSENEYVTDIYIRIVKIENICFVQTGSVHDWDYTLVPMGATCSFK